MSAAVSGAAPRGRRQGGFSLLEVAVVLLLVGLLLGGLLAPLGAQREQQRWRAAQRDLEVIRGALLAFAVVYGRLPCAGHEPDPTAAGYGLEDCSATAAGADGYLPWKTLGLRATDPWGAPRTHAAQPWHGHWHYRADGNFTAGAITLASTTRPGPDQLQVVDAAGRALTNRSDPPVALVYSLGADAVAAPHNASYESGPGARYQVCTGTVGCDDPLLWLGRMPLFDRLLQAGTLPRPAGP